MPIVAQLREEHEHLVDSVSHEEAPEEIPLFLPSDISSIHWETGCSSGLVALETKLRIAQAGDALDRLKHHLCVYSGLVTYKIRQVSGPGQKANTRARNLLNRFKSKIDRSVDRYRAARLALEVLLPTGEWQTYFKPLQSHHIRGPNGVLASDAEFDGDMRPSLREGEGRRELSWLWIGKQSWRQLVNMADSTEPSILANMVANEDDLDPCKLIQPKFPRCFLTSNTQSYPNRIRQDKGTSHSLEGRDGIVS